MNILKASQVCDTNVSTDKECMPGKPAHKTNEKYNLIFQNNFKKNDGIYERTT